MSLTADRPSSSEAAADTAAAPSSAATRRRRRALGLALTVLAVVALWPLGLLAGADYQITDAQGSARIDLVTAGGFTLVVGLVGWAVLALLERVTRHGTRVWTALAVLVTLASEIPVLLVEATTATRVALAVLHLVVGAVLVPAYVRARS